MTVLILALDALDAGLVEHFDISAFKLESSGSIETFAHSRDQPFTPEVWTTVATGLHPEEHGISGAGTSEWENPILEVASRFTGRLSEPTRGKLGKWVRRSTGEREQLGKTSRKTMFDRPNAVVRNWPGVTDGTDLQHAWDLMSAVSEGMSKHEFERDLFGLCAEQFGWAREMLHHEVGLAGVHIHTLDAAGHAYCRDEEALERVYERVGEFVTEVRETLSDEDELLLLSDHGMNTSFYPPDSNKTPSKHSWRAYASSTTSDIPQDMFDVVSWVERHVPEESTSHSEDIDIPMERLRELGYVN